MTSLAHHQAYVDWLVDSTDPLILKWSGSESVRSFVESEFAETIQQRMHSREWRREYRQACPVVRAQLSDYRLREIKIGNVNDLTVLAGIHFLNCDIREPFVGVYAQTRRIDPSEFDDVTSILFDQFNVFGPRFVQLWSTQTDYANWSNLPNVKGDQRILTGKIDELPDRPEFESNKAAITLKHDPSVDCFASYQQVYAEFFQLHPAMQSLITPENRASLKLCADANALFRIDIDDQFAGLIAARPETCRGIHGWLMIDEILATPFRGHNLAPPIQRLFIEQLERSHYTLVSGTIDAANAPSLNTARRVGRFDVGGWIFVHPE